MLKKSSKKAISGKKEAIKKIFKKNPTKKKVSSKKISDTYKTLFEESPIALYRTTPEGKIIIANPALVRLLGYNSFDEIANINLDESSLTDYPRIAFKQIIEKEGEVHGLESHWLKKDGTTVYVVENAILIRDKNGKPLYYDGTITDITNRKIFEDKLHSHTSYFETLMNTIPFPIFYKDLKFSILH